MRKAVLTPASRASAHLCRLLIRKYPIDTIVGHEEISPHRKSDPGPAFPLERLRDRLLGGTRQEGAAA